MVVNIADLKAYGSRNTKYMSMVSKRFIKSCLDDWKLQEDFEDFSDRACDLWKDLTGRQIIIREYSVGCVDLMLKLWQKAFIIVLNCIDVKNAGLKILSGLDAK